MKKIILIMVAFSLILATVTMALNNYSEHRICMHTQAIVRTMTTSTAAYAVHNHTPNNHNIQEQAVALEKTHDFANSADYMEGLTAISKRSIYCGDADRRACVKLNI
jgi:hypothetical protein